MTNYDQHAVRTQNRRNVLDYIVSKGTVSRQDISKDLGSSMTTVLAITNFLVDKGLVTVKGQIKTAKGRHPQLLHYRPDGAKAISIDYDAKRACVALCDSIGKEIASTEASVSNNISCFFRKELPQMVEQVTKGQKNILGAGIAMPGDFSPDLSKMVFGAPSEIQGIDEFIQLRNEFIKSTGLNLYCFNDGNAAAWGEYLERGGKEEDLVFIYLGDGLGAGLVLDGKLRSGSRYSAGEIGYMVFDPAFRTSILKPGWFENNISSDKDQSDLISLAIANVSNVLDVDLFVLNSTSGNEMISLIQDKVKNLALNTVRIEAPLCNNSVISGTARLVISREIERILES